MKKKYPYRVRIAYHGSDEEGDFRLVVFAGFDRFLTDEQQELLEDLCEEHLSKPNMSDEEYCFRVDTILDLFTERTHITCESIPPLVMQDIEVEPGI